MTDDFWDARDELRHVHDFARSRRTAPLSTLAVVLVRTLCHIPPYVVLPALVGGRTALNLPVALVGDPGSGKDASMTAGRDAVVFDSDTLGELPELTVGSGEGIARTFLDIGKDSVHTALFVVSEIDTLAALFERRGATLEAELRKLAMGQALGFANAQKETRTQVKALSYRAGLLAGVQPLRAGVLLNARDAGTPQRFLWMPTRDPHMPERRPGPVAPLKIRVSGWPGHEPSRDPYSEVSVPAVARVAIDRHQLDYHRGVPGIDPLDGHALLTRLKVAAALMVLAGRHAIGPDDWELAGVILLESDVTRTRILRAVAEQRRRGNMARALDTADRAEYVSERRLEQTKRTILRALDRLGRHAVEPMPRAALRKKLRSDYRPDFDAAISELIESEQVSEVETERGSGYVLFHPIPFHSTPPDQHESEPERSTPNDHQPSSVGVERNSGVELGVTEPDYGPAAIPATDESIVHAARMAHEHNRRTANTTNRREATS
jgi:hypothetical protein